MAAAQAAGNTVQAGPEGAVVSEFSTHSTDENDIFLDPAIRRIPEIEEDER